MTSNTVQAAFLIATFALSYAVILPFLERPKHDGVKRVCHLTSENFTNVVSAAEIAIVVFKDPAEEAAPKPPCPTELESFAEITAQVLRKRNIIVCNAPTTVLDSQRSAGTTVPQFAPGDVYIYKRGSGKPYYGRRTTSAVVGFMFKVNGTQLNVITGKIEKIAFDAVHEPKVVGFFMQGAADYLAYEAAAAVLSPSVRFYVVFDRVVARHLKLDYVGQIHMFRPPNKIPVPCPQNPATSADIEAFVNQNKGSLLTKIDKHNYHDPKLVDPSRKLILAIGEEMSPTGGYFYHLITKLIRNNTNNTEFQKLNIVWLEPQLFPTIYLMMDEMERTLGIPNKLPALGAINVTTLQSAWMNTATLNMAADRMADVENLMVLQDFVNNVITNTIIPVKLGEQAFVQTPTAQVIEEGSQVVLECVVENPVGDCLWLKDGQNIGFNLARYPHYSWRGNSAAGDCSLVISSVKIGRDDGEWVCEMTGDLQSPTLTSPPAKVVISSPTASTVKTEL